MSNGDGRTKLTPPELARQWGVSVDKILAFVHRGELRATNVALNLSGRPRFLIDVADIQAFEEQRSAAPLPKGPRRKQLTGVTEYF